MTSAKRSVMTLFSEAAGIHSHRVRLVLAEKGINVDVQHVSEHEPSEDLLEINPDNTLPTLVDRDLVLFEPSIMMEYLDERFPHPPLLPVYPIARAQCRSTMNRIEKDWLQQLHLIESGKKTAVEKAKKTLNENLIAISPICAETPFFLSEDFSLMDCYLAPLLLRLPKYEIEIPKEAKGLKKYMRTVFNRPSFQASLSDQERELIEKHDL